MTRGDMGARGGARRYTQCGGAWRCARALRGAAVRGGTWRCAAVRDAEARCCAVVCVQYTAGRVASVCSGARRCGAVLCVAARGCPPALRTTPPACLWPSNKPSATCQFVCLPFHPPCSPARHLLACFPTWRGRVQVKAYVAGEGVCVSCVCVCAWGGARQELRSSDASALWAPGCRLRPAASCVAGAPDCCRLARLATSL